MKQDHSDLCHKDWSDSTSVCDCGADEHNAKEDAKVAELILMRGIPGSGKSYVASVHKNGAGYAHDNPYVAIFSTDDFWYLEDPNVYNFDITRIREAHLWNQNRVDKALASFDYMYIYVDNTNLDSFAVSPYFDLAIKHGADIRIKDVHTPIQTCIRRQANRPEDRRVPTEVIEKMYEKFQKTLDAEEELKKAKMRQSMVKM